MKVYFQKFQGTGNDFVMIDGRDGISLTIAQVIFLCDRRFGVGSDGVIILQKSENADFYMNFYNPDGSQSFCGNGSRCTVVFADSLGIVATRGKFEAIDGVHEFEFIDENVQIHMRDVNTIDQRAGDFVINTGSPHYIVYALNVENMNLVEEAQKIRYNDEFAINGINVNFVEQAGDGIKMRTYERGVEGETLSCGTGVTAAALSWAAKNLGQSRVKVATRGGELFVKLNGDSGTSFTDIWLCGPAKKVFIGEIEI